MSMRMIEDMNNRRFPIVAEALAGPRRFEIFQKIAEVMRRRNDFAFFLRNNIDDCKYVETSKRGGKNERTRKNSSGNGCEQGAGF